mmetsp:Transcript_542/g.814  ORF Transcript_542/g.814 Transcript_542/m.814 type:complete len:181 (-) Transcript_542:67-609(-)|eukprot:CAMPEP_0201480912 /NCGR_PEP_ID=MMETSP0151_2-20130828/5282_1 /ASSEMBLY_ACC=CAM_ASM_000257 /TAXON_ID=200890 /ORGANISM="Paramoeba atlantica, Strain 621/1 / CCAP 1560/9" /LENGTH=180 /DNA_ID=CAMNT_0047862901 /DNA_START=51 /DNA_END=593 /DNA_ORIENTATION=+
MDLERKSHRELLVEFTRAIEYSSSNQERVFEILKERKLSFELEDMDYNPLHKACWTGNVKMTEKLLAHGADPNTLNDRKKCPLHYAAEFDQVDCAKLILERNETIVDVKEKSHRTPLFLAAEYRGHRVGALLLAHGADPNIECRGGEFGNLSTPASIAKGELKDTIENGHYGAMIKPAKR